MIARIEYLRLLRPYHIAGTMMTPVLHKAQRVASVAVRTDGVLQWILPDHLGSTSTTANMDGTLNSVIKYTAFGEIRATQGITPTKYRYTGQLAQAELGLDYYVSRWYDPYLNHWIQPDSVIPNVTNSMDYDRYAYTRNNPVRFTDNSGHCIDGITTVACLLIIGAVVLKVVDYGWTVYDTYQASQVLADPNSTKEEKDAASADIAMAVAFEAAEPDDLLPVSLPLDDLTRKGLISVGKEVGEVATEKAVKDFTASNFRENLMKLTRKTAEDVAEKQAHHVFPQEMQDKFFDLGIKNIHDPKYGSWVDKNHQTWSKNYNDEWRKFLEKRPKKEEIFKYAKKQAKRYGFNVEF